MKSTKFPMKKGRKSLKNLTRPKSLDKNNRELSSATLANSNKTEILTAELYANKPHQEKATIESSILINLIVYSVIWVSFQPVIDLSCLGYFNIK